MPSLRARILRRGFAVTIRLLRALRGGLPTVDAPDEELEAYALRARAQLEDIAGRLRAPRGTAVLAADGAPVRSIVVVAYRARRTDPAAGEVAIEHDPIGSAERVVLYLHGGAFAVGTPELYRGLAGGLARRARAAVVVPAYRLAPEHPFPAALDDVLAVWDWLTRDRGIDPRRIAVGGDSAGAGLAAALCLRLRDDDRSLPACLVGLSPWTDLAATGGSMVHNETVDIWVPARLITTAARVYAGDVPLDDPLVSPSHGDLTGLPPVLLHVGTDEVLLDDAERFVQRARDHGVDASLGRFDGLWHVFQAFPGFPESRDALQEMGAFVRRHTGDVDEPLAAWPRAR